MKKLLLLISAIALAASYTFGQYTKLFAFDSINGSRPQGSLYSDGSYLYGMTKNGGTNDLGVIFKIKSDGTGYAKLLDFAGASNGKNPESDQSLISDGTFLYGMTANGGTGKCGDGCGTIFKIKPDGTGYTKLSDFAGIFNGNEPCGSLISDRTFLYGMTTYGGINNKGTIFKIKPDGTEYTKLLDFAGVSNGSEPYGSLISDGTFLYGMTAYGGTGPGEIYHKGSGVIFKIKPDGTGYAKLLDFKGGNESFPYGSLISDGTFLYGITQGDMNIGGAIFKIKLDGTGYSVLYNFNHINYTKGSGPFGSLIFVGTSLYGMTKEGGTYHDGVIFKINPDGTGYTVLQEFQDANLNINPDATGYEVILHIWPIIYPVGSLISDGTFLYGIMTPGFGRGINKNYSGVIFKYSIAKSAKSKNRSIKFEHETFQKIKNKGAKENAKDEEASNSKMLWAENAPLIIPLDRDTTGWYAKSNKEKLIWIGSQIGSQIFDSTFKYDNEKIFSSITQAVLSGNLKAYTDFPFPGKELTFKEFSNILVHWDFAYQTEDPDHPGKMITIPAKFELTSSDITRLKFNETIEFDTVSYTLSKKVSSVTFYTYKQAENSVEVIGEKEIFYVKLNDHAGLDNKTIKAYFATQKESDLINQTNWTLMYKYLNDMNSPEFKYLIANTNTFAKKYTEDSVAQIISRIYEDACYRIVYNPKADKKKYFELKEYIKQNPCKGSEKFLFETDLSYYELQRDNVNYDKAALPLLDKYYMKVANIPDTLKLLMDDEMKFYATVMDKQMRVKALEWKHALWMLNDISYRFYNEVSDKQMLEKALMWAKKANELKVDDPAILDTYACLLFKTGHKKEAIKMEEKALEIINKIPFFRDRNAYEEKLAEFRK